MLFPRAEMQQLQGRSGTTNYGASNCHFEELEGRLDQLLWKAGSASIGAAFLRDDAKRFDLTTERLELPHGIRLTRAEKGVELIAPHLSLSELKLTVNGPFGRSGGDKPAPTEPQPTLQEKLRFLDSLSGRVYVTVKVELDLPVLGNRTLDQQLRVPIQEGSLDFRALDDSLDWLEGAFLDIKHDDETHKLAVTWRVPIFGSSHDLISWHLDHEAETIASFGRVPVRALVDFIIGDGKPAEKDNGKDNGKRSILKKLSLDAVDVALSLLAPRSVDVGHGMIMFGGDDQPGMVDFKVTGSINNQGPGALKGAIGSVDTTVKDLTYGPIAISADRLHFDGLDQLTVTFDAFTPKCATVIVHRVTATNLQLRIGR
ncbi:MAG TPA: hypothetical protein VGO00_06115 [Kofleriaceae bacterium]|nr:hypothetical protein [Kofleriaceae bacterium]